MLVLDSCSALKRGSNRVCALWSVTELNQTRRNRIAKSQISQSAVRIEGGKDALFLEDDALDTGK